MHNTKQVDKVPRKILNHKANYKESYNVELQITDVENVTLCLKKRMERGELLNLSSDFLRDWYVSTDFPCTISYKEERI